MIIILNDEIEEPIEDKIFEDKVHFIYQIGTKSPSLAKFTFNKCQFLNGISLSLLDISEAEIKDLIIQFGDCYIPGKLLVQSFEKKENQSFGIQIVNSLINEVEIFNSRMSSIQLSRSIIPFRFLVRESKLDVISTDNSLGNFIITDDGNCRAFIRYSEDNLFSEKSPISRFRRKLQEQKGLEKILYLPTSYNLHNLKNIDILYAEKSDFSGYELVDWYRDGKETKRKKYFLTKEDLLKLKISILINKRMSVTENVYIKSAILQSLSIIGESNSTVVLEHLKIDNVYLNDFRSKTFQMYDIKPRNELDTKFQIINSNFTDANFVKVYFNLFKEVNFYRSYFEQAKFSASKFPEKIFSVKNIRYQERKEEDYPWMQYELFRQLKTSLTSNNNQIQALEMHSKMYNALRLAQGVNYQDKLILYLNRISNNHSISIIRAFLLSIGLLIVLLVLYCAFLPNAPFKLGWYGLDEFKKGTADFFNFVLSNFKTIFVLANPVHNTSNLADLQDQKIELSTMNYFISFLSRITMAWLFYQFVSAFRKFGKSL